MGNDDSVVRVRLPDQRSAEPASLRCGKHVLGIGICHLQEHAEFFIEQCSSVEAADAQAAVSGKCHLAECCQQTAV